MCPFCEIVAGRAPATDLADYEQVVSFVPLSPVTPGHRLVVPRIHVADAAERPGVTGIVFEVAALEAWKVGPCNLITSVGAEATQRVFHLHVHVVPRHRGDGLHLPWTGRVREMGEPDAG